VLEWLLRQQELPKWLSTVNVASFEANGRTFDACPVVRPDPGKTEDRAEKLFPAHRHPQISDCPADLYQECKLVCKSVRFELGMLDRAFHARLMDLALQAGNSAWNYR
jgi:hypothetical protein